MKMHRHVMRLALSALLLGEISLFTARAAVAQDFDYEPLERALQTYVDTNGLVNYSALKQNRQDLDEMVRRMARTGPAKSPQFFPTREAQLAYWINAYNTLVLQIVVDHYPTASITKIGLIPYGVFFLKRVALGGEKLTLNHLEKENLRNRFRDARIHFGINSASRSCPPLEQHVYRPETLDQQLDAAARRFINDNREVTLDETRNSIVLSKVFDWYGSDFRQANAKHGQGTVLDYLKLYLTPDRQRILQRLSNARITYHNYDWSLNEQPTRD